MIILKLVALLIAIIIYLYIVIKKTEHSLSLYFFALLIDNLLIKPTQVRYSVIFQISFICLTILIIKVNRLTKNKYLKYNSKKENLVKVNFIEKSFFLLIYMLIIYSVIGYYNQYRIFSIMVDNYKILEIFLYYYFIKNIWTDLDKVKTALKVLSVLMCLIAFVEVFTTQRGGEGLYIIMCFTPMFFSQGLSKGFKGYIKIFVFSFIFVILSQTRTYILGFVIMCLIIVLLSNVRIKLKAMNRTIITFSVFIGISVILAMCTNIEVIKNVFNRFSQLSQGFSEAGGYRANEISLALSKIKENPLIGKGYGYLELVYIEGMGAIEWGDFMHNAYIEQTVKIGLVGISVYICFIVCSIRHVLSRIKLTKGNNYVNSSLVGGLASTIGWIFIYNAAPMSTFGAVFLPIIAADVIYELYIKKNKEQKLKCGARIH